MLLNDLVTVGSVVYLSFCTLFLRIVAKFVTLCTRDLGLNMRTLRILHGRNDTFVPIPVLKYEIGNRSYPRLRLWPDLINSIVQPLISGKSTAYCGFQTPEMFVSE